MSILIPNEPMPERCELCPCYNPHVGLCYVVDEDDYNGREIEKHEGRQDWCPLVEIAKPSDAIAYAMEEDAKKCLDMLKSIYSEEDDDGDTDS